MLVTHPSVKPKIADPHVPLSFFLSILLKQAKAFRDHNLADLWLEEVLRPLS